MAIDVLQDTSVVGFDLHILRACRGKSVGKDELHSLGFTIFDTFGGPTYSRKESYMGGAVRVGRCKCLSL